MANTITTTASAGGSGALAVIIINWWASTHQVNIPPDVALALATLIATGFHTIVVAFNKIVEKKDPSLLPVVQTVEKQVVATIVPAPVSAAPTQEVTPNA